MGTIATLAVKLIGDITGYTKSMTDAEKQAQKTAQTIGTNMKNIGGEITGLGQKATAGLTLPLVALGGFALNAASDVTESGNAVNVVFGEASNIIKQFGETAATEVGLARSEFNQLGAVTGAFLTNLGFDQKSAAQETINLTQRASDMASIFNTDVASALQAVQSGLKGEFNPLEQFGVKLNAAAINAQALKMGLVETAVSAAEVEKAQSSLGTAQDKWIQLTKDALKTGQITQDQYKELSGAIYGIDEAYEQGLLGTDQWNSAIEGSLDIWRQYSSILGEDGRKAILDYVKSTESIDAALAGTAGEITDNMKAQAALALIYEQTNQLAGDFKNTSDGLANSQRILKAQFTDAAAALGLQLMPYALQFVQWLSKLVTQFQQLTPEQQKWIVVIGAVVAGIGPLLLIIGSLVTAIGAIIPVITAVAAALSPFIIPILAIIAVLALLYLAWTNNWGGIQEKTAAAIAFIRGLIEGGMQFIQDLTSGRLGWLSQLWSNSVNTIMTIVNTWITNLKLLFQAFQAAWNGDWYRFGEIIRQIWDNTWKMVGTILQNSWANFKIILSTAVTSIINFFRSIDWGQVGRNILIGIANGMTAGIQFLINAAIGAAKAALQAVQGFLGIHSESTVFKKDVGWEMAAGAVAGWQEGLNRLLSPTMPQLTPVGIGAAGGTGAVSPASSKSIVINISATLNNKQDIDYLAQEVAKRVAKV